MMITFRFLLPCLLMLSTVTFLGAQCCCESYKDSGQEAYSKGDYQKAISEWERGKACPDASLCIDIDQLINQAQGQMNVIDNLTKGGSDTVLLKKPTSAKELDTAPRRLSDRSIESHPPIADDSVTKRSVVLYVCVDSEGNVISAEYQREGSTTSDSELINIAKNNALRWKFSAGGPEKQCGTITYNF